MEHGNIYELSLLEEFRKTIWDRFQKAVRDYKLISPGDRIAVCISGGKDSMLLALCMKRLQRYSKIPFDCLYLAMDPGYSEANKAGITENAKTLGIELRSY
ncbi:MAG: tRNA 2-thiocytidine biosynthesis protein TtcA, partial [Ruminococcus sp.]|nr:tRNA 2-thiocytidine biosynthesis protein TtcA [Ruminococcus sp.]